MGAHIVCSTYGIVFTTFFCFHTLGTIEGLVIYTQANARHICDIRFLAESFLNQQHLRETTVLSSLVFHKTHLNLLSTKTSTSSESLQGLGINTNMAHGSTDKSSTISCHRKRHVVCIHRRDHRCGSRSHIPRVAGGNNPKQRSTLNQVE